MIRNPIEQYDPRALGFLSWLFDEEIKPRLDELCFEFEKQSMLIIPSENSV